MIVLYLFIMIIVIVIIIVVIIVITYMKVLIFVIIGSVAIIGSAKIIDLDPSNLQLAVAENPYILIGFCPEDCSAMTKQFESLQQTFSAIQQLPIARINAEIGKNTDKFPTIYFYDNGQQFLYSGDLNMQELAKWIRSCLKPSNVIVPLSNAQNIKKVMLSSKLPALLTIYSQQQDPKTNAIIQRVCNENIDNFYCAEISPKYQSYQGSHDFFNVNDKQKTFLGFIKEQMKIAYTYTEPYTEITYDKVNQFVQQCLEDRRDRAVDNTIPNTVKFNTVEDLTNLTFQQAVKKNKYVLMEFYDPVDEGCRQFTRRYEAVAEQLRAQNYSISIGALNCREYYEECQSKLVKYYPTLRLYVNGHSVEYKKTTKIPSVMDLFNFISKTLSKEVIRIQSIDGIVNPALVFYGRELPQEINILATVYSKFPIYYIQRQLEQYKLELHLPGEVQEYEGKLVVRDIEAWVEEQVGPLLADLLVQQPDLVIVKAVEHKKPIVFLLDVNRDLRERIRAKFGLIAKDMRICGAYAQKEHEGFNSMLEWLHIRARDVKQTQLVYYQTSTDKKYLYDSPIMELTKQKLQNFITKIKNKQVASTDSRKIEASIDDL